MSSDRDLSTKPPRQSLTFRSRPVAGSSLEPTACWSELTEDPKLMAIQYAVKDEKKITTFFHG